MTCKRETGTGRIVDLVGKGGHVRTVPIPDWVRQELDNWLTSAGIERGKIFRRVSKMGKASAEGMTAKVVWHIVKDSARQRGIAKLAPHDLRRTCARICQASGGELEQIQMLLGSRLHPDHRTLSGIEAAHSFRRQ